MHTNPPEEHLTVYGTMDVKPEPSSPGKPGSTGKGKGKERQQQHEQFEMADWVQDPTLLDKLGGDMAGSSLGDPVKTIEVRWSAFSARRCRPMRRLSWEK